MSYFTGLMIEVHPNPDAAVSDGRQSLTLEAFGVLMRKINQVAEAVRGAYKGGLQ
jgi:3-deoxy-7-phosphoheptulonate synthase